MAIVITDNEASVFEVSDEGLEFLKSLPGPRDEIPNNKEAVELYKLEYERCSKRYDDLYNAAWTNFSYIALIAGAILTFAGDRFMPELSISLAALPLLFWWLASFETLNRYGDQVQERLVEIEDLINELHGFPYKPTESSPPDDVCKSLRGLRHYQQFHQRPSGIKEPGKLITVLLIWIGLVFVWLRILGFMKSLPSLVPILLVLFVIIWIVLQSMCDKTERCAQSPPGGKQKYFCMRRWSHVLRVRFIVRICAGAIIIIAVCSAYRAYTRHESYQENYIRRGASKSESK